MLETLFVCICGILLVLVAVVFLLWNEERASRRADFLDEAVSKCRPLSNIDQLNDSNNGHLVHLTGPLTTDEPLEDSQYGVIVRAVRLRRTVEMYQWVEHRGKEQHEVVRYPYKKKWMPTLVDSTSFYGYRNEFHQNPGQFPVEQKDWKANQTAVGSFYLSSDMYPRKVLDILSDWKPVQLSLTREMREQGMKILDNQIYYNRPWSPDIGDIRIRHDVAGISDPANPNHSCKVSIIACQSSGGQLTTYYSVDMELELLLLHSGVASCEVRKGSTRPWIIENEQEMLKKLKKSNNMMTRLYRGIGWCTSFIGFLLILIILILDDFPKVMINEELLIELLLGLLSGLSLASLITFAIGLPGLRPRLPWLYSLLQPYHIWLLNKRARNP